MSEEAATGYARELMAGFASRTGLDPAGPSPGRYLWTDAFAVCNYLGLYRKTGDARFLDLAIRLVEQVHHTLGRHRPDDPRAGWISGLPEAEGELHPTAGGLRIGKDLPERRAGEMIDERLEWDRDGQYFHYLTKWMHALNRVSRVAGDPRYTGWAVELAAAAHARFFHRQPGGGGRLYWKMSTDLSRPLVPAPGLHDPLDGMVTCHELRLAARDFGDLSSQNTLLSAAADMAVAGRGVQLITDDPLGIGGLLFDADRIVRIRAQGESPGLRDALGAALDAALAGLDAYAEDNPFAVPADHRLAFRELGLSIGLGAVPGLEARAARGGEPDSTAEVLQAIAGYMRFGPAIERFWLDRRNRDTAGWNEHREINTVMLATSILPDGFLGI